MHFGEQMAIYHFTCKYVSRAGDADKNAVRSAAYCAGEELSDMNTGATFNYSNKSEVVFSEIQAPANAPEWVADRQRLWSEVEKKEVRYDAKLMSQFEASLPNELDLEQCKALMYDFTSASLVKRGMVSDWSIHWHLHNKHVHSNTTTREISGEGFGKKVREWEEKKTLFALRKEWAECVNKHLAMAGFDVRIDHRSFKDQGIDHEPTVHVGPERAHNQEVVAERKARNRRTRSRNRIVDADKKADAAINELELKVKHAKELLEAQNNKIQKHPTKIVNLGKLNKRILQSVKTQYSSCRAMVVYEAQELKNGIDKTLCYNMPTNPMDVQACYSLRALLGKDADIEYTNRLKIMNIVGKKYSWASYYKEVQDGFDADTEYGGSLGWWRAMATIVFNNFSDKLADFKSFIPNKYKTHVDSVITILLGKRYKLPDQPTHAVWKVVREVEKPEPDKPKPTVEVSQAQPKQPSVEPSPPEIPARQQVDEPVHEEHEFDYGWQETKVVDIPGTGFQYPKPKSPWDSSGTGFDI